MSGGFASEEMRFPRKQEVECTLACFSGVQVYRCSNAMELSIDELLRIHFRVQLLLADLKKCLTRAEGLQQEIASVICAAIGQRSCLDKEMGLTPCPPMPDDVPPTRLHTNQPMEEDADLGAESVCSYRTHSSASSRCPSSLPSLETVDIPFSEEREIRPLPHALWDFLPMGQQDSTNYCGLRIFQILRRPDVKGNLQYRKWCTACNAHLSQRHKESEGHLTLMGLFHWHRVHDQDPAIWSYLAGRWRLDAIASVF